MSPTNGRPPDPDEPVYDLPEGLENIPLDKGKAGYTAGADDHCSFEGSWASLDKEATPENLRLRELFYEWLGQNGYDVHHRDEPTIIGDRRSWLRVWERYLKQRKLK